MTMKVDHLEWWCDVCEYGMTFESERECELMAEMHETGKPEGDCVGDGASDSCGEEAPRDREIAARALRDAAHDWDEVPDRTPRTGTDTGPWLVARAETIATPGLQYCPACGCSTPLGAHFSHCPAGFEAGAKWQGSRKVEVTDDLVRLGAIAGLDAVQPTWRATGSEPCSDDLAFIRAALSAVLKGTP